MMKSLSYGAWAKFLPRRAYQAVPAMHCRQALALSKKLALQVDLIAVNPELSGVPRMIQTRGPRPPKVILLQNGAVGHRSAGVHGDAQLKRPCVWAPVSRPEWLRKLRSVLGTPERD